MTKFKLPVDIQVSSKQMMLAMAGAGVACALLFVLFIVKPQAVKLTGSLSKMGKKSGEIESARKDIAKIKSLKDEIERYRDKVDQYEKKLPVEQEIPNLLENLSEMAKSSNITIVGITPVKSDKGAKDAIYQEFPILISAKSGYHELGSFISKLESADRFMKVVDISIKSTKMSPKRHDVELVVSTYILLKEKM